MGQTREVNNDVEGGAVPRNGRMRRRVDVGRWRERIASCERSRWRPSVYLSFGGLPIFFLLGEGVGERTGKKKAVRY